MTYFEGNVSLYTNVFVAVASSEYSTNFYLGSLLFTPYFQTLLLDTSTVVFELGAWSSLGVKAVSTALLGTITMQIYSGITTNYDK